MVHSISNQTNPQNDPYLPIAPNMTSHSRLMISTISKAWGATSVPVAVNLAGDPREQSMGVTPRAAWRGGSEPPRRLTSDHVEIRDIAYPTPFESFKREPHQARTGFSYRFQKAADRPCLPSP